MTHILVDFELFKGRIKEELRDLEERLHEIFADKHINPSEVQPTPAEAPVIEPEANVLNPVSNTIV